MNDEIINKLADAFCCWPLPQSVSADLCVTDSKYTHRTGTNLLTVTEACQMFKEVAAPILDAETVEQIRDLELENTAAWTEVEKLKRDKKVARVLELRTDLAALEAENRALREALDNEAKKIRWNWHDREVALESVEDDCQNADYAYGAVENVRIAVAVELPDEFYVWHEAGEEGENELFGPFATEAEATIKRDEVRQALAPKEGK